MFYVSDGKDVLEKDFVLSKINNSHTFQNKLPRKCPENYSFLINLSKTDYKSIVKFRLEENFSLK